ncbi:MAG: nucleotidyltransferase family protein [Acidimicrobiia bacterium]|nr:nucleotidyltransferase family protein [Acidimicrobiia bacterium]MDH5293636.1 nucleotidyltransferase family protein [Acidimicrobiia bacterium]
MIAIVPAAGRGTRLGSITEDLPKVLVPVGSRPAIDWVLDGLRQASVDLIVVVTGHLAHAVEAHVEAHDVVCVRQQEPLGTAHALLAAAPIAGGSDFVYAWGDVVASPAAYRSVVSSGPGTLGVNRVADPYGGAAVVVRGGFARSIVEKPPRGTSLTPYNAAGIGYLPRTAWSHLERVGLSPRGEYELTDALASMLDSGTLVRAVDVGEVHDVGTPASLATARDRIARLGLRAKGRDINGDPGQA